MPFAQTFFLPAAGDHTDQGFTHPYTAVADISEIINRFHHPAEGAVLRKEDVFRPDRRFHLSGAFPVIRQRLAAHDGKNNPSVPHLTLEKIHLPEEIRHELIGRAVIDVLRCAALLHDAPVDQEDPVAHGHGFGLIMGNINHGDSCPLLDLLDLKAHGFPQFCIQVAQGLVQQEKPRLCHQGPGQGDPLLLSAGKLVWQTLRVLRQMHGFQHFSDSLPDFLLRLFLDLQRIGHIFKNIHMRPDGITLKHHADTPFFRRYKGISPGNQLIADINLARSGLFKAGDDAQHRGLSAAGRPQEGDKLPVAEGFVKLTENDIAAKGFCNILDGNG